MSIYCSRVTVGLDHFHEKAKIGKPHRNGRVVSHPQNALSRVDEPGWPEGSVDTAHIPQWCVPGQEGKPERYDRISEWLRLSVDVPSVYTTVLLNEKAVRELVADLQSWLDQPKVKNRKPKGKA